ncbi:hypothetical protein ACEPAI_4284 [Sanghuangporus weigelae]
MDATNLTPPTQLDSTFGCFFLSAIFTSALWGIGCLQLYQYYDKYWTTDRYWLKAYICVVWLLDTAHQVLIVEVMYVTFVKGIVNLADLILVQREILHCAILSAFVDGMVQAIFVRRVWYISSKNRLLTGILSLSILAQFVAIALYYGQIFSFLQMEQFLNAIPTELAMNCIIAFTDTLIAVALIWLLRKSRSGFKRTDSLINRLVMYTIGSGLVTSIVMILALINVCVAPHALYYLLADLLLPKLYFNCMLASLNARASLRQSQETAAAGISFRLGDFSSNRTEESNVTSDVESKASIPRPIECRVDIRIDGDSDTQNKFEKFEKSESGEVTTSTSSV